MNPKISILIPCYNEERVIFDSYKKVKQELEKLNQSYEFIFCNDGSSDNTPHILNRIKIEDSTVRLISYYPHRGLGYAYRQLFTNAAGEILITMDADLPMDPQDTIPIFLREVCNVHIVVASRYAGIRSNYPLHRLIPSKLNLFLNRVLFKIKLTDTNSGFYAIKRVVLEQINLTSDTFEIHPELFVKVIRKGFKIKEVPVKCLHDTSHGELNILKYAPKTALNTLRLWWKIK